MEGSVQCTTKLFPTCRTHPLMLQLGSKLLGLEQMYFWSNALIGSKLGVQTRVESIPCWWKMAEQEKNRALPAFN